MISLLHRWGALGMDGWRKGLAAVSLAVAAFLAPKPAASVTALPAESLCAAEIAQAEGAYGIPTGLLDAISIVESGRYDSSRRATVAWPWTVMAEGQGRYLPTKAEALAEVRRLKAKGVRNIDVGCMQVNLQYHPEAFASLEDAFEPATNVAYAARFLKGLYEATNNWPTAASYYHSQTPSLAAGYRERLMKVWNAGGSSQYAMNAAAPVRPPLAHTAPLKPVPGSPRVEEVRRAWRDQVAATRDEARRIAEAYRQARMAEYQLRRVHFVDTHAASSLLTRH
jgi:uncharacterized membrane protein